MKQQYSTANDFYLETDKANPFHMHITSNSSSPELVELRNCAFILNKLSLAALEHPTARSAGFELKALQLFSTAVDALIANPMMSFKNLEVVADLVLHIERYYELLCRLSVPPEGQAQGLPSCQASGVNNAWPRVRSLLMAIEEKVPPCQKDIQEYVTIKRGLLEPDKKYFLSQMMAKKVQSAQLLKLIKKYEGQDRDQPGLSVSIIQEENGQSSDALVEMQSPGEKSQHNLEEIRMEARLILLDDDIGHWVRLNEYCASKNDTPATSADEKELIDFIIDIANQYITIHRIDKGSLRRDARRQKITLAQLSGTGQGDSHGGQHQAKANRLQRERELRVQTLGLMLGRARCRR